MSPLTFADDFPLLSTMGMVLHPPKKAIDIKAKAVLFNVII